MDCPSFPIIQASGRRWQKYWVKGWYYNALYPSQYYYKLYKEQACWADITGPTTGVPDVVCNMRDIGYIAKHFGAKYGEDKFLPSTYGVGCSDVYGDQKIDMRDIGFACKHFGHTTQP
jgi:hypothetical protein